MFRKVFYIKVIIIFSIILLVSCKNNSTNPLLSGNNLTATITGSENSSFSALSVSGNTSNGMITVIGASIDKKLTLTFSQSATGTLTMGATGNIGTYSAITSLTDAYISSSGTLIITQNDTKVVAGTFSFSGIFSTDLTKNITVTNGSFTWNK
ncbi:MAG: DUF6252 family protein [FCB group bacterium]|jgi:hypothetical protein